MTGQDRLRRRRAARLRMVTAASLGLGIKDVKRTQAEVATALGITRARVKEIERNALTKLVRALVGVAALVLVGCGPAYSAPERGTWELAGIDQLDRRDDGKCWRTVPNVDTAIMLSTEMRTQAELPASAMPRSATEPQTWRGAPLLEVWRFEDGFTGWALEPVECEP